MGAEFFSQIPAEYAQTQQQRGLSPKGGDESSPIIQHKYQVTGQEEAV